MRLRVGKNKVRSQICFAESAKSDELYTVVHSKSPHMLRPTGRVVKDLATHKDTYGADDTAVEVLYYNPAYREWRFLYLPPQTLLTDDPQRLCESPKWPQVKEPAQKKRILRIGRKYNES